MREPDDLVEVTTTAGTVRGRWRAIPGSEARSAAFLGIPFAEAPVGELRFAAPVPKAPWDGVRDALAFGATAQRGDPGVTLIPEPSVEGESTLNVNVFTPRPESAAAGEGLPVLVCYGIAEGIPEANARHWAFLLEGLVEVGPALRYATAKVTRTTGGGGGGGNWQGNQGGGGQQAPQSSGGDPWSSSGNAGGNRGGNDPWAQASQPEEPPF